MNVQKNILQLEKKIEKIKAELLALGDLRPGSLSQQYNVCGNPKCRCKADPPQKHGPYYQLSFTRHGKSGTCFVRKAHVKAVKQQVANYATMKQLMDRWIELATELCVLKTSAPEKNRPAT